MTKLPAISESVRARLAALANRELTVEEWRTQAAIPLLPEEIEHTRALVRWFRYPTTADRLAYVRRANARWQRATEPERPSRG